MTVLKFADSFWDKEWTGTSGSEALMKRMRIGKATCKDLVDYFRERASIEKDYGSKLQKLFRSMEKKAHNTNESETLDEAISVFIAETEIIAAVHSSAAQNYSDYMEKLQKFSDMQKEEKKKLEENMKKSQSNKISQYNKTMSCQKQYQSKCRERNDLKRQLESLSQSVTAQAKDLDKMKAKLDKAQSAMEQADTSYKTSVETLEQVRLSWEKEMEELCNKFQELEEERIDFLRNELWVHCNIMSEVCVDVDKHCERIRQQLEHCSIEQDIADFITSNKTGGERPGKIEYENYFSGKAGQRMHTEAPAKPSRPSTFTPARPHEPNPPGYHVVPPKKGFRLGFKRGREPPHVGVTGGTDEILSEGDYATVL